MRIGAAAVRVLEGNELHWHTTLVRLCGNNTVLVQILNTIFDEQVQTREGVDGSIATPLAFGARADGCVISENRIVVVVDYSLLFDLIMLFDISGAYRWHSTSPDIASIANDGASAVT